MEDFTRLPITQAGFLMRLVESQDNTATADSRGEGGTAKELHRKGYVRPFGTIGRRIRWKLTKLLNPNEIRQLRELVQSILRVQYKDGSTENFYSLTKHEILEFQDHIDKKKGVIKIKDVTKGEKKEVKIEDIDAYVVI